MELEAEVDEEVMSPIIELEAPPSIGVETTAGADVVELPMPMPADEDVVRSSPIIPPEVLLVILYGGGSAFEDIDILVIVVIPDGPMLIVIDSDAGMLMSIDMLEVLDVSIVGTMEGST